jgi:hypothetical protein
MVTQCRVRLQVRCGVKPEVEAFPIDESILQCLLLTTTTVCSIHYDHLPSPKSRLPH